MQLLASSKYEKGSEYWQAARIKEIAAEFYVYCEKNLKIRDKDGTVAPLIPNRAQRRLVDRVLKKLEAGEPVRFIILKARQMGFSTIIEALIYWWSSTRKNVSSTITAHLDDAAKNIYEMFRRYYDNCLPQFQPSLKYNTKKDLTFAVLGSQIKTASAENGEVGRSSTQQVLHNSEVAFWKNGDELVAGLLQTIPYRPNTMVFHESTANGIGGYFYETWQAAKRGDSIFEPIFEAWFALEEYQLPVPKEGIVLSNEEQEMKEMYELTDEQIMWRRMKIKEFGNDLDRFKQEYPSNDMEAFIASGRPRFDIKALLAMEKRAVAGEHGDITQVDRNNDSTIDFSPAVKGPLQLWERPNRVGEYIVTGDVAEGLEHGDYSVATVLDRSTMKTVGRWRGHCDPDVFGDIMYMLGRYYNNALLCPEVNNHGLTTLQRLVDRKYPKIFKRETALDERLDQSTSKLGWRTDLRTKPLMIDHLAQAIREGTLDDPDITFIRECMTYVVDENGRTNAQEGCFDDTVISMAIALQMYDWSYSKPSVRRRPQPKRRYDPHTGRPLS